MSKYPDIELRFHRITDSPVLTPNTDKDWEAGGVFNPAVIKDKGKYKMIYRAFGRDKVSRLGYAESADGLKWSKSPLPIVEPDPLDRQENRGVEDPRIVRLDGKFYITYTAAEGFPVGKSWHWRTAVRILQTSNFKEFIKIQPVIDGLGKKNDKDAVLFPGEIAGSYWLLHRMVPDIRVASSKDLVNWGDEGTVLKNRQDGWSYLKVGGGAPPILTEMGWLMIYHGVRRNKSYALGAAIMEAKQPQKLTHLLPYPIFEPEKIYELVGIVPNVVFGTSILEVKDTYRIYYGAADRVIGTAAIDKTSLLSALAENKVG